MPVQPFDLVTKDEYKIAVKLTATGSDGQIDATISAVSRAMMVYAEREFAPLTATATRRFQILDDQVIDLAPYDLRALTSITLHPEGSSPRVLAVGESTLLPVDKRYGVWTHLQLANTLSLDSTQRQQFGFAIADIAGAWGWAATADVPADIKRWCIEGVRAWIRDDPANWSSMAATDPRTGGPAPDGTRALPLAVLQGLSPYVRYSSIG